MILSPKKGISSFFTSERLLWFVKNGQGECFSKLNQNNNDDDDNDNKNNRTITEPGMAEQRNVAAATIIVIVVWPMKTFPYALSLSIG